MPFWKKNETDEKKKTEKAKKDHPSLAERLGTPHHRAWSWADGTANRQEDEALSSTDKKNR
jgi:hypothetical protein